MILCIGIHGNSFKSSLGVREDILVIPDEWGNKFMFNRSSGGGSVNVVDLNYIMGGTRQMSIDIGTSVIVYI